MRMVKERDRRNGSLVMIILIVAIIALLAAVMTMLYSPQLQAFPFENYALESTDADDCMRGMVLLDIVDSEAISYYHVNDTGVYVLAVDEQSEAYRAGIRSGDRIIIANGIDILDSSQLMTMRSELLDGEAFTLTLLRGTQEKSLEAVLCDMAHE